MAQIISLAEARQRIARPQIRPITDPEQPETVRILARIVEKLGLMPYEE
jgi:hypothetical protein